MRADRSRFAFAVVGLAALLAPVGARAAAPHRFAIVVGANQPGRADLPTLSYADDDAVRTTEVLWLQGVEVRLLTALDADTSRLYPWAVALAKPPTRAELLRTVREVFARAAEAKTRGEPVDFYLVYSGHGGVADSGEGALLLPDAPLTRGDLYREVLERSPADFNHLMIDACHAVRFVSGRGDDELDRRLEQSARAYLDRQTLDRFPQTGVIAATSAAAKTHEWSEYQAGVFSHELRSALLGAADVDGDDRVTYREVGAFISAANERVQHAKARVDVFVRPPAREPARALASWSNAARLVVETPVAGHLWIEDERGVRLAEANKSPEQPLALALLPRERYYLTVGAAEYGFAADGEKAIRFASLAARTDAAPKARGSIDDALRKGLFAVPFGRSFYGGYSFPPIDGPDLRATARSSADDRRSGLRKTGFGLLIGAAAVGAGAAAFYLASESAFDKWEQSTTAEDRAHWRERTRNLDWGATLSAAAAVIAAGTGTGLLLYDRTRPHRARLAPIPGGLVARLDF